MKKIIAVFATLAVVVSCLSLPVAAMSMDNTCIYSQESSSTIVTEYHNILMDKGVFDFLAQGSFNLEISICHGTGIRYGKAKYKIDAGYKPARFNRSTYWVDHAFHCNTLCFSIC